MYEASGEPYEGQGVLSRVLEGREKTLKWEVEID